MNVVTMKPFLVVALASSVLACTPAVTSPVENPSSEPFVHELDSAGEVCFRPGPAGEPMEVHLIFAETYNTCGTALESNCEVTLQGEVVRVEGSASIQNSGSARCGELAQRSSATCEIPSLEAGTYTLTHGSDTATFEVPNTGAEHLCVGST